MSTLAVDARRPARDPGRMYPPPPITTWGWVLRIGGTVVGMLFLVGIGLVSAAAPEALEELRDLYTPWRIAVDVGLTLAACWLITLRRRRPLLTILSLLAMSILSGGAACFLPWAMVSLATRRRWREVVPAVAGALVSQLVTAVLPWNAPHVEVNGEPVEDYVLGRAIGLGFGLLWTVVYVAIGFYIGARRDLVASLTERAETAEREQRLQVEAGKAGERARIAREMHDVLAHRISLVSMHAGVLAYRDDLPPEKTKEIAGIIQENAHASLTELRQVLATLREPTELGAAVEKPQPTLADVAMLVREAQLSGTQVALRDELDDDAAVPAVIARHAYRMIQEALTNARKHAQGAPVHVLLHGRPGKGLSLEVRNTLTHDTGLPGARLGLVGLAERAQLLNGTFEAGPEHGDFVVRAWLPWEK